MGKDIKDQKGNTYKISPFYRKYMEVQGKYPNAIIAYRLGDFYEVMGDNARTVANELDLTLTGRDCGLEERVLMVGYPYHIAKDYEKQLTEKGYKLAIVEEENEIRLNYTEKKEV